MRKPYNMFCLPPAGSSASIYSAWKKIPTKYMNVIPVEYAGHGLKMQHALIDQPELLARTIVQDILQYSNQPFILFGHSVGGGLIWAVQEQLHALKKSEQLKLMIVSSRPEHQFIQHLRCKRTLSDEQIIQQLKRYNHFPIEILNYPDALHFFLKIIRNDFLVSDRLLEKPVQKASIPLLTFHGKDDPDIPDRQAMQAWQQHSEKWLGSIELEGDHFYFTQSDPLNQLFEQIEHCIESQILVAH